MLTFNVSVPGVIMPDGWDNLYGTDPVVFIIICALTFIFGAGLGSFSSALAYRVPRGLPWIFENGSGKQPSQSQRPSRSCCPHCYHTLRFQDLIPVLSWLFSGGKCRYCNKKISPSYLLLELLSGSLCLTAFLLMGINLPALFFILSIPFFIALTVIDLRHYILPDQLLMITLFFGILYVITSPNPYDLREPFLSSLGQVFWACLSAAFFAGFIFAIGKITSLALGRSSLGLGDVKLFAVCGVWLGIHDLPYLLIFSGIFGVLLGLVWRAVTKNKVFPFGPAIICALIILVLCEDVFLSATQL